VAGCLTLRFLKGGISRSSPAGLSPTLKSDSSQRAPTIPITHLSRKIREKDRASGEKWGTQPAKTDAKACRALLVLDGSETRPYMAGGGPLRGQARFHLLFQLPTFVPVDVAERFVLMCNYTGKEVV